ncbi:hypothetical protein GALMADRAFT_258063 [Galerina marginata CBS 339.88]|uniref:Hexosyltransferase n=1 Tax=Galerina marginata (strain CBS 339.88) TaxID=685588 RepID=A0A067S9H5_GALM3|nr:hypothetical protein GALMADRAFT_258063 [Galerina marginata CBS 339.88]
MYPPTGHSGGYVALPSDPEGAAAGTHDYHAPLRKRLSELTRRPYFRPVSVVVTVLFFMFLVKTHYSRNTDEFHPPGHAIIWPNDTFSFALQPKPSHLDTPLEQPVVVRLAIISRVDGFERRQALRDAMLVGVPARDIQLDYKFFVGKIHENNPEGSMKEKLEEENSAHNDVIILNDLPDVPERISEKRFAALKWTNSVPQSEYDYSMTLDSDTFCRLRTLVRRLRHDYPEMKPREEPVLLGRMASHKVYFENTIADGNTNDADEDFSFSGPWFSYPAGIGYILSSNLLNTILSAGPAVPHHINYPSDDVMIGSWVAGLKNMHDPEALFETSPANTPPPQHRLYPTPYLPYAVNSKILDDVTGWHDFPARDKGGAGHDSQIGWESTCIHRMSPEEMRAFRAMDEVKEEWNG